MTKLTFDVDFTKDPEEILQEIQERAKAEVAKRESKIKSAAFLSNLHEKVNQEIGTDFKTVNDLIRALTAYANPKLRDKISSTSPSGRRVTISMSKELFEEIKSKLSQPNSNKAAIARETGASVVQVRKVANGGFDAKFASSKNVKANQSVKSEPSPKVQREAPAPEPSKATPPSDEAPTLAPPAPALDLPPAPLVAEPTAEVETEHKDAAPELPPILPPSMDEEVLDQPTPLAPPPAPSLDLPTAPLIPEPISPTEPADDTEQESPTSELPPIAAPSIGEDIGKKLLHLQLHPWICHQSPRSLNLLTVSKMSNLYQNCHQLPRLLWERTVLTHLLPLLHLLLLLLIYPQSLRFRSLLVISNRKSLHQSCPQLLHLPWERTVLTYLLPLLHLLLLHLICHQLLPLPRHQNQMQQFHQVQ